MNMTEKVIEIANEKINDLIATYNEWAGSDDSYWVEQTDDDYIVKDWNYEIVGHFDTMYDAEDFADDCRQDITAYGEESVLGWMEDNPVMVVDMIGGDWTASTSDEYKSITAIREMLCEAVDSDITEAELIAKIRAF